jgi:S1-C subfamily serine protease
MRFHTSAAVVVLVLFLGGLVFEGRASARIYRYKDKDGRWSYTNDPSLLPEVREETEEGSDDRKRKDIEDLQESLSKKIPARSPIEKARNATVALKSTKGIGSGFFITDGGYILTNKHVVEATAQEKAEIKEKEQILREARRGLKSEYEKIMDARKRLSRLKGYAPYEEKRAKLEQWLRDYEKRKADFDKKAEAFKTWRQNMLYPGDFRAVLADNTELPFSIVTLSYDYDLALVKVSGYITPFIRPGDTDGLVHGQVLYAIGNPSVKELNLRNTVTSGIFSGRRNVNGRTYVQTNAQINPGNSGGALVTEEGRVIGINTWKLVGEKVEGLGFAIPIQVALEEFKAFLGRYMNRDR